MSCAKPFNHLHRHSVFSNKLGSLYRLSENLWFYLNDLSKFYDFGYGFVLTFRWTLLKPRCFSVVYFLLVAACVYAVQCNIDASIRSLKGDKTQIVQKPLCILLLWSTSEFSYVYSGNCCKCSAMTFIAI